MRRERREGRSNDGPAEHDGAAPPAVSPIKPPEPPETPEPPLNVDPRPQVEAASVSANNRAASASRASRSAFSLALRCRRFFGGAVGAGCACDAASGVSDVDAVGPTETVGVAGAVEGAVDAHEGCVVVSGVVEQVEQVGPVGPLVP